MYSNSGQELGDWTTTDIMMLSIVIQIPVVRQLLREAAFTNTDGCLQHILKRWQTI